jgi:hypothetical protein
MFQVGQLENTLCLFGALFALWKGGVAERGVAVVVIANLFVGQIGRLVAPSGDQLIRLVSDGLTALILLGITVRYAALWMGGVMMFFAIQFSLHSYYLVMERPIDHLYAVINNFDFVSINLCLIIGVAVAWSRRERIRRAAEA